MRRFAIFRLRLRSLFVRSSVERDLDDELRFHLEKTIEQNIAAGMTPEDARFAARREFGNPELQKDECRDSRGTKVIEDLFEDLRYAARGLRRNPLLALAATATLALCIGANTTVFSLVNSILIRPLPYPGSDRIYYISDRSGRNQIEIAAGPDYYILRKENRVFEDVAAYNPTTMNWSGVDKPEQIDGALVTPSFFRLLGTEPLLGRYLAPAEEGPKAPPVVVLSYAFWRNRLGSDPRAVGKTITLDRLPHTIIGVMPQGFDYPPGNPTPIWVPLEMDEASQFPIYPTMRMRIVSMLARRRPQVSPLELETEMRRLSYSIRSQYPKEWLTAEFRSGVTLSAIPLQERLTGDMRPALLVLTSSVGLVLLIACVNLANLLLARATARQRELAVRLALGSSQGRIVRQMLTESVVLALPGGLAGATAAWLAVVLLNAHKPLVLVRYPPISLDTTTLVFTFALTLATGLVFGLVPAFTIKGVTIHDALKSAGHTQSGGRRTARLRQALVVAELGISLVLLIGAGLLARSFLKLANRELGFPAEHLLTLRIHLTSSRYAPAAAQKEFYSDLLQRIEKLPMVRGAAESSDLPLSGNHSFLSMAFQIAGHPTPMAQRPMAGISVVSPQFFQTMGIPLQSGRVFESQDANVSPASVVVNDAFARKIFLGENPLGKRLEIGPARCSLWDRHRSGRKHSRKCPGRGTVTVGLWLHLHQRIYFIELYGIAGPDHRRSANRHPACPRTGLCNRPRPTGLRCASHGRAPGELARSAALPIDLDWLVRRHRLVSGGRRRLCRNELSGHAADPRNRNPHGDGRAAQGCRAIGRRRERLAGRSSGDGWSRRRLGVDPLCAIVAIRRDRVGCADLHHCSRGAGVDCVPCFDGTSATSILGRPHQSAPRRIARRLAMPIALPKEIFQLFRSGISHPPGCWPHQRYVPTATGSAPG